MAAAGPGEPLLSRLPGSLDRSAPSGSRQVLFEEKQCGLSSKFEKRLYKTHPAPRKGPLRPSSSCPWPGTRCPPAAVPGSAQEVPKTAAAPLTQVLVVDAQVVVELGADLGDQRQVLELGELLGRRQLRHGRHGRVRGAAETAP